MRDDLRKSITKDSTQASAAMPLTWYRDFRPKVLRICLRFVPERQEAEDLCQEVFVKVLWNWAAFRGDCQPMTWITAIARNVCLTHVRNVKRKLAGAANYQRECDSPSRFKAEDRHVARILLQRTLAKASHSTRSILGWYFEEGWSHQEIAEKLGVSRVAVTRALTRVKRKWEQSVTEKQKVNTDPVSAQPASGRLGANSRRPRQQSRKLQADLACVNRYS